MSSKYSRKRKVDDNEDTSGEGVRLHEKQSRHRDRSSSSDSRSPSPKPKRSNREKEEQSEPSESLSIEETNKLRASLGLAPLEIDDGPKVREADDGTGEKIYNEDGFEFTHRKAANLAETKKDQLIKEKLEVSKAKRQIYSKVLKASKLAESDDEDSATNWVEKMRQKEEEKEKAAQRAKMFDAMDEDFGITSTIEAEKAKKKKKREKGSSDTAGLVVGHAREAFLNGAENQILVLDDKGVLDDGDEVLINPNIVENERHARNVENKKKKDPYRPFDEEVDQFGHKKHFGVLAKYDEELDGAQREMFRLNETGGFDLEEEKRELDMRKKLEMAGKKLVSLEMPKYQLASEFYTQEEMVAFRKPKSGKKNKSTRSRKILKASDLVPIESSESNDRGRRRRQEIEDGQENTEKMETEDGEVKEEVEDDAEGSKKPWKKAMHGNGVDLDRLKILQKRAMQDSDESEDELHGGVDLTGVVIDDNAEDELHSVLSKTRKIRQNETKKDAEEDVGKKVQEIMSSHGVKMEVDEDGEEVSALPEDGSIYIDSTMEYCRNIGDIPTYGLAGNRKDTNDDVNVAEKIVKEEEDETEGFKKWKREQVDREIRKKKKQQSEAFKGGWLAAGEPAPGSSNAIDSDDEEELEKAKHKKWSDNEEEEDNTPEYENVLGNEADVSKGVGAMLKLAAQKGYLVDPNASKYTGPNLDHLKNRSKTQIDAGKYDIEDKYMKKLDRLGTTGRGPIQPFPEKRDYNPEVVINYVDKKGREMDAKDAYRELSYKFHGRNPGKKQLEKRNHKREKQEKLLHTNSYDTPLGTLSKQLKKQKQLSTPYLVLSGSTDHSSLKKE